MNIGVGHRLLERGAHAVEIAGDRDIEPRNLLAVGVKEENIGLTHRNADHVDAPRGSNDRIRDFGVCDQYVFDVCRQVDGDRFANSERNRPEVASLAAT